MKILLDACTPRPLRSVTTAQEMGWGGLKNGDLLRKAEGQFEVFISTDQNLKHQQQVLGRKLAILVLPTNDWPTIRSKGAEISATVDMLNQGILSSWIGPIIDRVNRRNPDLNAICERWTQAPLACVPNCHPASCALRACW